jgi:hypothetical protein
MMVRWSIVFVAPVSLLVGLSPVLADEPPGCPPGEWFCDDATDAEAEPLPEPEADDVDNPAPENAPPPGTERGDVDVDVPPAPSDLGWSEGSGDHGVSPWGLAVRVEGVLLEGGSRGGDARLGGIGISGRYALNEVVTFDLGLDSILGTDYNGYDRSELSLSLSSLFFLNQHPVVRTYLLAGLNTSAARVEVLGEDQTWGYLGVQGGLGLDFTLDARLALNIDILAFMRGRTDSRAAREPEFTDASGRVSNTSGGGLLRGGVTLHF